MRVYFTCAKDYFAAQIIEFKLRFFKFRTFTQSTIAFIKKAFVKLIDEGFLLYNFMIVKRI